MKPISLWTQDILNQYASIFAAAAPTPDIQQLFTSVSVAQVHCSEQQDHK
jgi:hypothetical protein